MSRITYLKNHHRTSASVPAASAMGVSEPYLAEWFVLRRQVRNRSTASRALTLRAERIAVQTRHSGISTFRALDNALSLLGAATRKPWDGRNGSLRACA